MRKITNSFVKSTGAEKQINTTGTEVPVVDRRLETRAKCFRGGKVILNELGDVYECIFKDLSWFGARLQMQSTIPLPKNFKIAFASGNNISPFSCTMAWRDGDSIGVIFTQTKDETVAA